MTSSKRRGQTLIEVLVGLLVVLAVVFGSISIAIQCWGSLVLSRWAAFQSECVATNWRQGRGVPPQCAEQTKKELKNSFGFREVTVLSSKIRGEIIHTEIKGRLPPSQISRAVYDLGPSEYKRVFKPYSLWDLLGLP